MKPKTGIGPSGVISGGGGGLGGGQGKVGNPKGRTQGAGVGGKCACPACGTLVRRVASSPCRETECPECGAMMTDAPQDAPGV